MIGGLSDFYLDNETKRRKDEFEDSRTKKLGLGRLKNQDQFEKSIFDNKAKRIAYEGTLDKLRAINEYAMQENARINWEKLYDEETRRMVSPYIEKVGELNPNDRRAFWYKLNDRMREKSGNQSFLHSVSDDGLTATFYENGRPYTVDVTRDFDDGSGALGTIGNKTLDYGLRKDELAVKQQNANTKELQTIWGRDINQQRIDQRDYFNSQKNDPKLQAQLSAANTQGKVGETQLPKLEKELHHAEQGLARLQRMKTYGTEAADLLTELDRIALGDGVYQEDDGSYTLTTSARRALAGKNLLDKADVFMKDFNASIYDKQKALGGQPRVGMIAIEKGMLPNFLTTTSKAFVENSDNLIQNAQQDIAFIKDQIHGIHNTRHESLRPRKSENLTTPNSSNRVKIKAPNGLIKFIPAEDVDAAIQAGGEKVV